MIAIVIVDEAEQQLRAIDTWWREHRLLAPDMVVGELERCLTVLAAAPDAGPRFMRSTVPGVRRILMKRTRHHVYYLHDEANAIVYIIAIWGTPKQGDPLLRDPRGDGDV